LPPYDDKTVKDVVQEIRADNDKMKELVEGQPDLEDLPQEVIAGLLLYNDLIDRNRRCLLAYLFHRLEMIEGLRWEVGIWCPDEKIQKLHEDEKRYLSHYNNCLDTYMKRYVDNAKEPLDLTADAQAPEELNVQIRVIGEGIGEILTQDSGTLKLCKGWVHTAKRTDVELLIRAGKVEHVRSLIGGASGG